MKSFSNITHITGVLLVAVIAMVSCAKISAPSGGPKDIAPPVILGSVPENGTKMFDSKSFTVTFDEFVVLDKINEKFMASPPLKTKPEILIKGKSLQVKWDEELADSTTYTFYFQDAIRDNNEGNVLNNYNYVFSTGNVIDSLSLSGNVLNAENLEAASDVLVMMYSNLSDTAPATTLPAYITRPDFSGGFTIRNVKPGNYRLFALNDLNANKLFDDGEEKFAFYDSIIKVTPEEFYGKSLDTVKRQIRSKTTDKKASDVPDTKAEKPDIFTFGKYQMFLYTEEPKKQYMTSSERKSAGSLLFTLAVPSDTGLFDVSLIGVPDTSWFMEKNSDLDTFRIWITNPGVYTTDLLEALVKYPFTDSTNTLISRIDTVKMRFITKAPNARTSREKKPVLSLETNIKNDIKPGTKIWFKGNAPLSAPDTSHMVLVQTIDSVKKEIKPVFQRDEKDSRRVFLKSPLVSGAMYTLICKDDVFSDIYSVRSDSMAYRFRVSTPEEYGRLTVNLGGFKGSVIAQLLNEKETVVNQKVITAPGKVVFELIEKGKYRLRVIYDLNNDGKYTTGNFSLGRQPEPVSYYPEVLDVKVNWDIEQDEWDISKMNTKDLNLRKKPESKSTRP